MTFDNVFPFNHDSQSATHHEVPQDDNLPVTVVVCDHELCRFAHMVDYNDALTIWAAVSEDPSNWDELCSYWARYRTPVVSEFLATLPFYAITMDEAVGALGNSGGWIVFDLRTKRLIAGKAVQYLGHRAVLGLGEETPNSRGFPLPICLPPWWEVHQYADPVQVSVGRHSPLDIPRTSRSFLYGEPLYHEIALHILNLAKHGQIPEPHQRKVEFLTACQSLIVDVHREWLMRPRSKLGGRRVRDLIHGGVQWHSALVGGQMLRLQEGGEMVAISPDSSGYKSAPLGREEIIVYFDLCRALIAQGFAWCNERHRKTGHWPTKNDLPKFRKELRKFCQNWLVEASDVGSPNKYIIECSRRRVPQAPGVSIVGMEQEILPENFSSCECPICQMMGTGDLGVGVTMLAGRQLEKEGEFAFSICESIESWQHQQEELKKMSAEMDRIWSEHQTQTEASEPESEELESVWKASVINGEIPGDSRGHISLAFRLAEIVGQLQIMKAPKALIQEINQRFREYRKSTSPDQTLERQFLFSSLEVTADQFPPIRDKVADFQSLVFEYERRPYQDESDLFPH